MNKIVAEFFEKNGFTVEDLGDNSYIADNGIICIPFSEAERNVYNPELAAVSFLSCDKDHIKEYYKNRDGGIGYEIFHDYMTGRLKFTQFGGICNHDHSLFEIQQGINYIKDNGRDS